MATTHTEVYRGFKGQLADHPFRWLPLFLSEFKVATRKKLPLLLLYGPVGISTIVAMVMVYLAYTVEAMQQANSEAQQGLDMAAALALASVKSMLQVRSFITDFYDSMSVFCLLAATWFGSGLICEDRRVNAHLLYFSRPLNRSHYFFGKFVTVASFGAFAMLLPGLLICLMAVVNSPDYAFVKEQGDVIINSTLFALLWIASVSSFVLAISSLAPKKLFALVGVFAFFILSQMAVEVARGVADVNYIQYLSPSETLSNISHWMMARPGTEFTDQVMYSFIGAGTQVGLALLILARRLKRMELSV